jgi:ribonuclease R
VPLIYRCTTSPRPRRSEALREFLDTLDIRLAKGQSMRPGDFNKILCAREGQPSTSSWSNEVVLRSAGAGRIRGRETTATSG